MVSESDTGWYAIEEVEPRRGWIWGGVPARTLDPEGSRLGGPTSIGEGNECQWVRWAPKGGELWDPTSVGEENETFFIRVWNPLSNIGVLNNLREKSKEDNICDGYRNFTWMFSLSKLSPAKISVLEEKKNCNKMGWRTVKVFLSRSFGWQFYEFHDFETLETW